MTRPKPTSQFILATENGEPLLAWWRYGLGVSVAFTSDAKTRWAAEWITWPEYSSFRAKLVRNAMRKSDSRGTMIELEQREGKVRLALDAVDESDQYLNNATGKLTVIGPDLRKEELELVPTAPGRYEADLVTPKRGGYHFQFSLHSGEKVLASQSRGIIVGYPDELRLRATNEELLSRIAASSGGKENPSPGALFEEDSTRTAWKIEPMWPYLLTAALFLYVFDVLLRRIDLARRRRASI